jgi:O-6-methylguanine DNA methyltransferase
MDVLEKDLRDLGRVRAPDGFADRVLAALGGRPRAADWYADVETPIGVVHVAWNAGGVAALRRAEPGDDFEGWFVRRLRRPVERADGPPARLGAQLADALAGRGRRLRYDLAGLSPFEQDVLRKTLEIPRGEVRTYAWVAREIGRPRAVRAVGTALGHNPIPLLIPCHRVVRSDGFLGEYSMGGTDTKRAVLGLEGVDAGWLETLAGRRVRFVASRTTGVFCVPTCRNARRIQPRNEVRLRDEQEAREAGFRPCAHCRPAAAAGGQPRL